MRLTMKGVWKAGTWKQSDTTTELCFHWEVPVLLTKRFSVIHPPLSCHIAQSNKPFNSSSYTYQLAAGFVDYWRCGERRVSA